MLPSLVSRTCTAFVPRSSVVKTKPSAVSPGAIGPSRNPWPRKKSSMRALLSQAVTSLSGTSPSNGRNTHPIAPKAESRRKIEKWLTPAASSGVK